MRVLFKITLATILSFVTLIAGANVNTLVSEIENLYSSSPQAVTKSDYIDVLRAHYKPESQEQSVFIDGVLGQNELSNAQLTIIKSIDKTTDFKQIVAFNPELLFVLDNSIRNDYPALKENIYLDMQSGFLSVYNNLQSTSETQGNGGILAIVGLSSVLFQSSEDETIPPAKASVSISSAKVAESAQQVLTLTASLSKAVDVPTTLNLSVTSTPTNSRSSQTGSNFILASTSIVIPAGEISKTTTLTITDNADALGSTDLSVKITSVSGATNVEIDSTPAVVEVVDDESVPVISLSATTTTVKEGDASILLNATSSVSATEDIVVSLSFSGSAENTVDYTTSGTITIPAGSTNGNSSFSIIDDNLFDNEVAETVVINIDSVAGAEAFENGDQSVSININDNDVAPMVTMSASVDSVSEDGISPTITATLSHPTYQDLVLALATSGTATTTNDFSLSATSITVPSGSTTGTATVNLLDDNAHEQDEIIIVSVDSILGAISGDNPQPVSVAVNNDDSAPTVVLSTSAETVLENDLSPSIIATLSNPTYQDIVVSLATSGTALSGNDYTLPETTVTVSAGDLSGLLTVNLVDDTTYELSESLIVSVGSVTDGAEAGVSQTTELTIENDDPAPTVVLTLSSYSQLENNEDAINILATLSNPSYEDVYVTLIDSGSAIAGYDWLPSDTFTGEIIIGAGELTGYESGYIIDDGIFEGDETVIFDIENVYGGAATEQSEQQQTFTILENESAPVVTLSASANSIEEASAGTISITATLSEISAIDTVIFFETSGTATEGSDYSSMSDITIPAGTTTNTSSITFVNDTLYESDETVVVEISNADGAIEESNQLVSLTILEDESAPTMTLTASSANISEKNGSATITATLSSAVGSNLVVAFSTSGSASHGTDYNLNAIEITQGDLTGASLLTAIADTDYEAGSERAVVAINSVSGVPGVIIDATSVAINITNEALDSGTTKAIVPGRQAAIEASIEYQDIDFYSEYREEDFSPYENINLAQALAYDVEISTAMISIMDGGYMVNGAGHASTHQDLDTLEIKLVEGAYYGAADFNYVHGTQVAVIAAGDLDGDNGLMGVAPGAQLHLADIYASGFHPEVWALLVEDAELQSVDVQNNSWGFDDSQYGEFEDWAANSATISSYVNKKDEEGWTGAETLYAFQHLDTDGNGYNDILLGTEASTDAWQAYIDALDSLQDQAPIVFAITNNFEFTDADVSAALPELFPELEEAWISVVNVDIQGQDELIYELYSGPCGSTAEYCMAADGTDITLPKYSDAINEYTQEMGTSFAAPQVSGAIALLSVHFPNHTPEQLVDRLLASANNDIGFDHTGYVTFGNGVMHGYSHEAGHGILDVYAALLPITSSSYSARIYAGEGSLTNQGYAIESTSLVASRSFGNTISNSLQGVSSYYYDALGGGFDFELSELTRFNDEPTRLVKSLHENISALNSVANLSQQATNKWHAHGEVNSHFDPTAIKSNKALSRFLESGNWNGLSSAAYAIPQLSTASGGEGIHYMGELNDWVYTLSYSQNARDEVDRHESYSVLLESQLGNKINASYLLSSLHSTENGLGLMGNGAFDFDGGGSKQNTIGLKYEYLSKDKISVNVGWTSTFRSDESFAAGIISSLNGVKSDAFELGMTKYGIFANDKFSLSISQPDRVYNGDVEYRVANLADNNGVIDYNYTSAQLNPDGRQLDYILGYSLDLGQAKTMSLKYTESVDMGHIHSDDKVRAYFIGYFAEDAEANDRLSFGLNHIENTESGFEISYKKRF